MLSCDISLVKNEKYYLINYVSFEISTPEINGIRCKIRYLRRLSTYLLPTHIIHFFAPIYTTHCDPNIPNLFRSLQSVSTLQNITRPRCLNSICLLITHSLFLSTNHKPTTLLTLHYGDEIILGGFV